MPGRSPHRRSPPPPPLISRHSPSRGRVRSPGRHSDLMEMPSTSRGRDRREFRPQVRRSRSPVPKGSFSPPLKRKVSPSREREMSRRTKISKSPVVSRGGSRGSPDHGYIAAAVEPEIHKSRNVPSSERYRDKVYEEDSEVVIPHFRGPENSIDYDINELKKFTVEVVRNPQGSAGGSHLNRTITNPDIIVPVRRPDEGSRPLFLRAEPAPGPSKERERLGSSEVYRRVVNIDTSRGSGRERERSRERVGYSPGPPYEEQRRPYYADRERSPYEQRHRSPPREEYVEVRGKHRERRASSRDDLRHGLDVRRREERKYTPERYDYERESDLRSRINEKRSEPHPHSSRIEEREHSSRRYESERERDRHGRPHHSPPPRERRRGGSLERHEPRSSREGWERERGEHKRRPHSREREERREGRERYEHTDHYEDSRRSQPYKTDFEPKKFYKHYEDKEFIPPPTRGRGGPGLRGRGGPPPIMRGRGMVPRGPSRGFRGGMMIPRGIPRAPFIPMRGGFPPRFFPPF